MIKSIAGILGKPVVKLGRDSNPLKNPAPPENVHMAFKTFTCLAPEKYVPHHNYLNSINYLATGVGVV